MPAKASCIFIVLLCAAVFSWSVYRDILLEKQYAGDLRNRVVGARMQKDGLSPYFYKWKTGDALRYYDPNNFDSLRASNITASPFFHRLLGPVADLPQRTLSKCWLLATYCMFIATLLLGMAITTEVRQRWLLLPACLFLLTEAWKMHIGNGQNYIVIPLLAMAFYFFIRKKKQSLMGFAAGCCAVTLVLIKPTAVLFFLPFVFLWKQYSRTYIAVLLVPVLVCTVWLLTGRKEIYLWQQYRENIVQQVKIHQHESPDLQINGPDPLFGSWEGIDRAEIAAEGRRHPLHVYSENGNVFVLVRQVLHKKMNTVSLAAVSLVLMLVLAAVFYRRHSTGGYTLPAVATLGYCLFMLSDLFSPVYRHQYYAVQWIFPVLLAAAYYQPQRYFVYAVVLAGLVLNVLNISFFPMQHTLGEYIMLIAFIVLSLRREKPFTE